MQWILAATIIAYVVLMLFIARVAQRKVKNQTDYLIAGRRLGLSLAWMTLLATWFGAGTILAVADDVQEEGIRAAALDPLGAGICLLLVGWFIAARMWRFQIETVPDLFAKQFGKRSEIVCSCVMIPSYFGWIATQFVALGGLLELIFGLPISVGILLIALVTTIYTMMGGMWSVTLTDSVQVLLLLVGLIFLVGTVLWQVGEGSPLTGFQKVIESGEEGHWVLVPLESRVAFFSWLGLLAVGALGNIPGQDLMQRVFAAKSAIVARRACLIAGFMYLLFGAIAVYLAAGAAVLLPGETEKGVLATLAQAFLTPPLNIIFIVVIFSAVMSTIDSAILAPSAVLSKNLLQPRLNMDPLKLNRICVGVVAFCSLLVAYSGKTAYELLEDAYAITMVGLFVPMIFAIYSKPRREWPALASMLVGISVWGCHFLLGWESFLNPGGLILETDTFAPTWFRPIGDWQLPISLVATLMSLIAYVAVDFFLARITNKRNSREPSSQ